MYDPEDMERLVEKAGRGRPRQSEAVRRRNYTVIVILMDTGLRIVELVELWVGDVDFIQGVLVAHNGRARSNGPFP